MGRPEAKAEEGCRGKMWSEPEGINGQNNGCDSYLCKVGYIPATQARYYRGHTHARAHTQSSHPGKQDSLSQFKDTSQQGKSTQENYRTTHEGLGRVGERHQ